MMRLLIKQVFKFMALCCLVLPGCVTRPVITDRPTNPKRTTGMTPLHHASWEGHVESVQLLLKQGADVHARDRYQSTAVHYATRLGALSRDGSFNAPSTGTKLIELLADAGADLDARDQSGSTALHLVVNLSVWDCRDAPDGETMFFEEETQMAAAIARALLSKGASIDLQDADGNTPLHLAASAGNLKLVQLLVQQGARTDVTNHHHRTASMLAKRNGHTEIVSYLRLGNKRSGIK
jgi:cytohesin